MKTRRFTPHSAVVYVNPPSSACVKAQLGFTKIITETMSHVGIAMAIVLVVMLKLSTAWARTFVCWCCGVVPVPWNCLF